MAKQIQDKPANTNNGGYNAGSKERKADAWGNIQLKLKDGSIVNFSSGTNPVYEDQNQLHRSLVKAAQANGGEVEIPAKFVVKIAPKDDGTELQFDI